MTITHDRMDMINYNQAAMTPRPKKAAIAPVVPTETALAAPVNGVRPVCPGKAPEPVAVPLPTGRLAFPGMT